MTKQKLPIWNLNGRTINSGVTDDFESGILVAEVNSRNHFECMAEWKIYT
jgi:hypothetical protein